MSQITGVIDWDLGLFGDPLYDVAHLFFWREEQMLPLIEQLENGSKHLPQWQERILCYQPSYRVKRNLLRALRYTLAHR